MTRKEYDRRVDRLARISTVIAVMLLIWYVYSAGSSVFLMATNGMFGEIPAVQLLSAGLMLAAAAVIIVLMLKLILSLRGDASPFTLENAGRLRVVGCLLIAYELVMELISRLSGGMTIDAGEGAMVSIKSHNSLGGLLIVTGLAVLAISCVFQYGVELQKLSDETL